MSETRLIIAARRMTPEEVIQQQIDAEERKEREFWQTVLNGLNTQKAGIEQQAKAIRERLGIEERRR